MWVSPSHPDPPRAAAPRPSGRILAAFPRRSPEGLYQELRITLDAYMGRPYLAVRLWQQGRGGDWWPLRGKGVSIRLSEAAGVADVLRMAEALPAARPQDGQGPRRQAPAAPPAHRPPAAGGRPYGPSAAPGRGRDERGEERPRYVERRQRPEPRTIDPADLGGDAHQRDFDEL